MAPLHDPLAAIEDPLQPRRPSFRRSVRSALLRVALPVALFLPLVLLARWSDPLPKRVFFAAFLAGALGFPIAAATAVEVAALHWLPVRSWLHGVAGALAASLALLGIYAAWTEASYLRALVTQGSIAAATEVAQGSIGTLPKLLFKLPLLGAALGLGLGTVARLDPRFERPLAVATGATWAVLILASVVSVAFDLKVLGDGTAGFGGWLIEALVATTLGVSYSLYTIFVEDRETAWWPWEPEEEP
jgi:hypothetical protein